MSKQKLGQALRGVLLACLLGCAHSGDSPMPAPHHVPPVDEGFELALFQSTGVKFEDGAQAQLLYNGKLFDALVEGIKSAKVSVDIVLYIWRPGDPSDRVLAALAERTAAGVTCRVLVDPVGSTPAFQKEVMPRLKAARCDVEQFRPVKAGGAVGLSLARNHRKIVVIDGRLAFTGGFGFHKDWLGNGLSKDQWRDTSVRVEGNVVAYFQVAFAENWQEAGGPLLLASDFPPLEGPRGKVRSAFVASSVQVGPSNADRMTQLAIASARHRLWIANAYFVPPNALLKLLVTKAREGVDVRILTTGPVHDVPSIRSAQRASYEGLIREGIHIYEYQPSMMHAKTMVVDDELVVVGSINFDPLSFNELEEGSFLALDKGLTQELTGRFLEDVTHAKEMSLDSPELPGPWGKFSRGLFRWMGSTPGR